MATRRPLVIVNGNVRELPADEVLMSAPTIITDHGALSGLADDDHPQYLNQTRGDARYAALAHTQSPTTLTQDGATTGQALVWNGTAWAPATYSAASLSVARATMTATQTSSVTALASITELVLPLVANGVYQIDAFVTFQSDTTTTGANIGLTTPSGCRNMVEIVVPITSTAAASQLRTIFPNAAVATNAGNVLGTGVTATASNHTARIKGTLVNGSTAGNCQLVFASEVASSVITLQIGSELQLLRIA